MKNNHTASQKPYKNQRESHKNTDNRTEYYKQSHSTIDNNSIKTITQYHKQSEYHRLSDNHTISQTITDNDGKSDNIIDNHISSQTITQTTTQKITQ